VLTQLYTAVTFETPASESKIPTCRHHHPKQDQRPWLPNGTIPTGDTASRRHVGQAPHGHLEPRQLR
jgi:hypothetical protein